MRWKQLTKTKIRHKNGEIGYSVIKYYIWKNLQTNITNADALQLTTHIMDKASGMQSSYM